MIAPPNRPLLVDCFEMDTAGVRSHGSEIEERRMRRVLSILVASCVIFTAVPIVSFSQSTGATLSGVIRNQTGELVSGAIVISIAGSWRGWNLCAFSISSPRISRSPWREIARSSAPGSHAVLLCT